MLYLLILHMSNKVLQLMEINILILVKTAAVHVSIMKYE